MSMAAEYSSTASAKRPSPNSVLPFALCSSAVWTSAASMLAAGGVVVMDAVTAASEWQRPRSRETVVKLKSVSSVLVQSSTRRSPGLARCLLGPALAFGPTS